MFKGTRVDSAAFASALTSFDPPRPPFLGVHRRTAQGDQREAVGTWLRRLLVLPPSHPVEVSEWVNPDYRRTPHVLVLRTRVVDAPLRLSIPKAAEKVALEDIVKALAHGNTDASPA